MTSHDASLLWISNEYYDAVTPGPEDQLYFVEPLVEKLSMTDFLANISSGSKSGEGDIRYLQSQNGNLYSSDYFEGAESFSEFQPLRTDVPSDIPFCTEALGRTPDAVNLWIGDGRSITNPYENIYTVLRGAKHFTLLPPTEGWCLKGKFEPTLLT
ncbi:hypothetical protein H0H87_009057 [Tephrocybe sp. NHM501043]|nr:hypothetical protein H0H87_009057 [Tephrocybe sp. NHM501043]